MYCTHTLIASGANNSADMVACPVSVEDITFT